jgi:hypothetical protein
MGFVFAENALESSHFGSVIGRYVEGNKTGMRNYTKSLRDEFAKRIVVGDEGGIPRGMKVSSRVQCGIRHPGLCPEQQPDTYRDGLQIFKNINAVMLNTGARGDFYKIESSPATANYYFRLSLIRRGASVRVMGMEMEASENENTLRFRIRNGDPQMTCPVVLSTFASRILAAGENLESVLLTKCNVSSSSKWRDPTVALFNEYKVTSYGGPVEILMADLKVVVIRAEKGEKDGEDKVDPKLIELELAFNRLLEGAREGAGPSVSTRSSAPPKGKKVISKKDLAIQDSDEEALSTDSEERAPPTDSEDDDDPRKEKPAVVASASSGSSMPASSSTTVVPMFSFLDCDEPEAPASTPALIAEVIRLGLAEINELPLASLAPSLEAKPQKNKNPSWLVYDDSGLHVIGSIRFNINANSLDAHCMHVDHQAGHLSCAVNRVCAKQPLAFLVAWLRAGLAPGITDRDRHFQLRTDRHVLSFPLRIRIRKMLMDDPGYVELLSKEVPPLRPEPERLP